MIQEGTKFKHKGSSSEQGRIEYGLIEKDEIDGVAQIYLQTFPHRVRKWFHSADDAQQFYRDLMELMRLAYGRTFFAARHNNRLIGYLILTLPNRSLFLALLREGFILRVAAHALTGCYGFSFYTFGRALKALFAMRNAEMEGEPPESPHVYVIAVEKQFRGRGIGSALLQRARFACRESYNQMWLYVEVDNVSAIRLYERIGFQIVNSDSSQHLMVWDFKTSKTAGQTE